MPIMSSELYDALLDAGASEEKARKGAEAVASHDQRFPSLEGKIDTLRTQLTGEMNTLRAQFDTLRAELKGEMAWIKWMMGTNLVFTLGVLWKLLKP